MAVAGQIHGTALKRSRMRVVEVVVQFVELLTSPQNAPGFWLNVSRCPRLIHAASALGCRCGCLSGKAESIAGLANIRFFAWQKSGILSGTSASVLNWPLSA